MKVKRVSIGKKILCAALCIAMIIAIRPIKANAAGSLVAHAPVPRITISETNSALNRLYATAFNTYGSQYTRIYDIRLQVNIKNVKPTDKVTYELYVKEGSKYVVKASCYDIVTKRSISTGSFNRKYYVNESILKQKEGFVKYYWKVTVTNIHDSTYASYKTSERVIPIAHRF